MPSTTTYRKGDVVLLIFPFSDLSTAKRRPALIVSPNSSNSGSDVVVAYITSQMSSYSAGRDVILHGWNSAGLPKPSLVRMKFATLDKVLIIRKLGELKSADLVEVEKAVLNFFNS